MDKESNIIKMDRFILKANGSKIKSMGTPLFTSKVEKKWRRDALAREFFQERERSFMKMEIRELKENGPMVNNNNFIIS